MRRKNSNILVVFMLLSIAVSAMFIPNMVASHVNIGTLNYLETKIYQVQGNLSLIFNYSDTGTNDLTLTNLGYVISTNKTVLQFKSNNISYNWSFVNNTKAYYYFDLNSNNTYSVSVNYQSIHVPKSPYQLLREMLEAKNATIALLNTNISKMNHTITNLTKNNTDLKKINVNLSAYANETRANNTPLHMQIVNLTSENDRLNGTFISLRNSLTLSNTSHTADEATIKELRDPWCTGYTYNDEGFIYINTASMAILLVILIIVGTIFVYRTKIKQKGKKILKDAVETTHQSKADTSGFIEEQIKDAETDFLQNEKRKEVEDKIVVMKEKNPEQYKKMREMIDKMDAPTPPPKTTQKTPLKKTEPTQTKEFVD